MVNQAKPNVFNVRKSTYLVNSCNDLPDTEKVFRRIQERWQWEGLVGKKPDIAHLQQLVSKDIFLYMGHGTGTGHLS